jgi:HK97 family phage prohead protease
MSNRAYAVLEIKAVNEDQRIISGTATTPTVDRVGDIIEPLGAKFQNPLPFLWQHAHDMPVGQTSFGRPTEEGIPFETKFVHPNDVESMTLKDRLALAWDSVKTKLVRAVSIGFRPLEYSFMDSGGIRYTEVEIYELSAVTIPANAEALINEIKSFHGDDGLIRAVKALDAELRREHNIPDPEIPEAPAAKAASGKKAVIVKLDAPARDRAPFVINKIHTERKRA